MDQVPEDHHNPHHSSHIKTEKITMPVAVVLSAVVIGGSLYAVQYSKQQSIERQQHKEYVANRTSDCLAVYKTEDDKWNNVLGWKYVEDGDDCLLRYKDPNPKPAEECDNVYSPEFLTRRNSLCKEGEFENNKF